MRIISAILLLFVLQASSLRYSTAEFRGDLSAPALYRAVQVCAPPCASISVGDRYHVIFPTDDTCEACVSTLPGFRSIIPPSPALITVGGTNVGTGSALARAAAAHPESVRAAGALLDTVNFAERDLDTLTSEEIVALDIESAASLPGVQYAGIEITCDEDEMPQEPNALLVSVVNTLLDLGADGSYAAVVGGRVRVFVPVAVSDPAEWEKTYLQRLDLTMTPLEVANGLAERLPFITRINDIPVITFFNAWTSRIMQGNSDPEAGKTQPVDVNPTLNSSDTRWMDTLEPPVDGSGQMIIIGDTGVDEHHCFFYDPSKDYALRMDSSSTPKGGCLKSLGVNYFESEMQPGVYANATPPPENDPTNDPNNGTYHRKIACINSSSPDYTDETVSCHGTHCAGTLAGAPPTVAGGQAIKHPKGRLTAWSLRGVAYGARLFFNDMGILINGSSKLNGQMVPRVYFGFGYAAGARVASSSWGSNTRLKNYISVNSNFGHDDMLGNYRDLVSVVAAGNEAGSMTSMLSGRNPFFTITNPCLLRSVICVGAVRTSQTAWHDICNGTKFRNDGMFLGPNYQVCQYATRTNVRDFAPGVVAQFSSRGPAFDGRAKPEFVAPGDFVFSSRCMEESTVKGMNNRCTMEDSDLSTASFYSSQGTSMATPALAGTITLLRDFILKHGLNYDLATSPKVPSSALIKALLTASAQEIDAAVIIPAVIGINSGEGVSIRRNDLPFPSSSYGYGRPNLRSILDVTNRGGKLLYVDETGEGVQCTDENQWKHFTFDLQMPAGSTEFTEELKITTAFTMAAEPSSVSIFNSDGFLSSTLVLYAIDPAGNFHVGNHGANQGRNFATRDMDRVNGMQRIAIPSHHVKAGTWHVYVHCMFVNVVVSKTEVKPISVEGGATGVDKISGSQPFAMAVLAPGSASLAYKDAAAPVCPNNCWIQHRRGTCVSNACECKPGWGGLDCSVRTIALTDNEVVPMLVAPKTRLRFKYFVKTGDKPTFRVASGANMENIEHWSSGNELPWSYAFMDVYAEPCKVNGTDASNDKACDDQFINVYQLMHQIKVTGSPGNAEFTTSYFDKDKGGAALSSYTEVDPNIENAIRAHPSNSLPLSAGAGKWWVFEVLVKDPIATGTVTVTIANNSCANSCNGNGTCTGTTCKCYDGYTGSACNEFK